ncbi:MAG: DUF1700 domain-containing protein [Ruminococcaceae bacterium]|nr:DUF1700 domain-containing protein [Oscillospiraceae bacterium]
MNKQEFLSELKERLSGLPQEDVAERIGFYSEMIDDRIEEGLSEEEAVAEVGSTDDVVSQIVSELPLASLIKEKVRPRRTLRAWEIVCLILGSPIWLSLLITAFAAMLSLYVAVWSVLISLWAVGGAFVGCFIGGVLASVVFTALLENAAAGVAMLGAGILCAGLSIFTFLLCNICLKGILILTKKTFLGIKIAFVGKERAK